MGSRALWAGVVAAGPHEDLEHFNELVSSWPVQLAVLGLYLGLVVIALTRGARDWEDGPRRRFRVSIAALGVFLVLDVVFGRGILGWTVWPYWTQVHFVEVPLFLWLCGMWLYYIVRFMTRARPGAGDPEARRRGAALQQALDEVRGVEGDGAHPPSALV